MRVKRVALLLQVADLELHVLHHLGAADHEVAGARTARATALSRPRSTNPSSNANRNRMTAITISSSAFGPSSRFRMIPPQPAPRGERRRAARRRPARATPAAAGIRDAGPAPRRDPAAPRAAAARAGLGARGVEHRDVSTLSQRTHVADRHHADQRAVGRLRDVHVVAEIGQRAPVEAFDARIAARRKQATQLRQIGPPAAPQAQAALEVAAWSPCCGGRPITFGSHIRSRRPRVVRGDALRLRSPRPQCAGALPGPDGTLDLAIERLDVRRRRARAPRWPGGVRAPGRARRSRPGRAWWSAGATGCAPSSATVVGARPGSRRAALPGLRHLRRLPVAARRAGGAARREARASSREQLARLGGLRDVDVRPVRAAPDALGYRAAHHAASPRAGGSASSARARTRWSRSTSAPIADPVLSAHTSDGARAGPRRCATAPTPRDAGRARPAAWSSWRRCRARRRRPTSPPPSDCSSPTRAVRGAVLVGAGTRVVVGDPDLRVAGRARPRARGAGRRLHPGAPGRQPASWSRRCSSSASSRPASRVARPLLRRRQLRAAARAPRACQRDGVERSAVAVDAARANAARLGLARDVPLRGGRARRSDACRPSAVDAIVLDPPRAGAAEACRRARRAAATARRLRVLRSRHARARRARARRRAATGSPACSPSTSSRRRITSKRWHEFD